jgi:protease YdgD
MEQRMRQAAIVSGILALLSFGAMGHAQDQAINADVHGDWKAVGRLDIRDQGFCTAALIDIDIVVTAAHCLIDHHSDGFVNVERVTFHAGLRNGTAEVTRQGRSITVHPAFDYFSNEPTDRSAHDLALVQLSQPIRRPDITPFPTGVASLRSAEVTLVSYGQAHIETPVLQHDCRFVGIADEILVTDCNAEFGTSGAPVFQPVGGNMVIVSVVSARADLDDGRRVTLGPNLAQTLPQVIASSRAETGALGRNPPPQVRVITPGERVETGAKFLRP